MYHSRTHSSACIVDAFFCNPPRYVYDINWVSRPDRSEHCLSDDISYGLLVYQGALSFVTDLAIFMLPIPALVRMQITKGKWLAMATIFASAAVASITPIIRLQNAKFQRDTGVNDLTCNQPPSKATKSTH
ncbi:putative integral membrane protein [Diaporthe ampelina]|uniref:Putative integral membrane protein n=1 Tax=Diaporthe ampelina TaxID=1214573 RepID=A0A0G2FYQ7_9PEZI|nr:putative integral membrane protein [Diaporthe ampelina]